MKFERLINFMHHVQYRVRASYICVMVSFMANDEGGYFDIRFDCREFVGESGGITSISHVSRRLYYDTLADDNFDFEVVANDMVDYVESLYIKKEN